MGHEMGHYVLHHIAKDIYYFSVVIVIFFALLRRSLERALAWWGGHWQVRGIGDTCFRWSSFWVRFLTSYTRHSLTRTSARRVPQDEPGAVEEWIFFDHPSGRNRIHHAMRWKAENLQLFTTMPNR